MDFFSWKKEDLLIPNKFGIKEPNQESAKIIKPDKKTLIIIPSVGLDKKGNRLGMGAGYYDRYLEKHTKGITLGCVFSFALLEKIPSENHDIKVHYIITEKESFMT